MSIPVICDRCRSTGNSGEADFSHLGDLLDFTPVPRKKERVDGWSADKQRAFIAALAATGSKRRAAMSLGMAAYGIDQMLKSEGNESFKAACERAMAIAQQNGTMKIASGIADAAARNAQLTPPSRLRRHDPAPEEPAWSDDQQWDFIQVIGNRFLAKVEQEREARLDGRIVAADFYLRQITYLEVLFDLGATEMGWEAQQALRELRRGGHPPLSIVTTPFDAMLDEKRREYWESQGDPPRPVHPPAGDVVEHNDGPWGTREHGFSIAAEKTSYGALTTPADGYTPERWAKMTMIEQRIARDVEWERAAAEQVRWEAKARQDYDERRASDASA
jgi:hypothetical protein